MNIEQAAAKLRSREVSAVELARESLESIRQHQPLLNAFITITEEVALEQARKADEELARGFDRGPLHGIPYALKDMYSTKGIRTTCGSKIFAEHIPDHDAAVYERLRDAGAVLMGKTGLHELAYGISSNNPHFGTIRNPLDRGRIPGGSSGGSGAAVATGMVFFAMGSDTGGSIRIPAAYCGCVGLKPTSGRVSRYGTMPLDFSLDHMGPLTRTVRDAALVMNAIAGFDDRDDTSSRQPVPNFLPEPGSRLHGIRVGVPQNFFNERVAPEVASAFASSLEQMRQLGAAIVPVTAPDPAAINTIGRVILLSEASALMEPYKNRRGEFGPDVLALLDQGRFLSATDYINAQRLRRVYQREWTRLWEFVDVIATPTTPIQAPEIGTKEVDIDGLAEDVRLASTRFVRCINVLGLPALAVPFSNQARCSMGGLQLIGKAFEETEVLRSAGEVALATPFRHSPPEISYSPKLD